MTKTANTNCLEGMKCPQCGALEPFNIEVKTVMDVRDRGTGDVTDVEWEDDSYCQCAECAFTGTVKDFKVAEEDPQCECQNCGKRWAESQLVLPIPDLAQRVMPNEPMPSGECPECGALCHEVEHDEHNPRACTGAVKRNQHNERTRTE